MVMTTTPDIGVTLDVIGTSSVAVAKGRTIRVAFFFSSVVGWLTIVALGIIIVVVGSHDDLIIT